MKKTKIHTKEWLDWNVGEAKRFQSLHELLKELKAVKKTFGPNCGYAGGNICVEIATVEYMIRQEEESE